MMTQDIKVMTHTHQKPVLRFAAILFCATMFASVQASQISEIQSLPLNENTHQIEAPSSGELIVTLHPLSTQSIAENNYRQALIHAEQNDLDATKSYLQQALLQNNAHIPARELLVSLLLTQHNPQAAIAILDTGIVVTPEHSKFPLWLAQIHIKLDAYDSALRALEKNADKFEREPAYLGALANLYQQSERHNDAHDYYLQASRLAPHDNRWWLGLGMTAEKLSDWNGAQIAYQRAKENSFMDDPLLPFVQKRLTMMSAQLQQ